MEPLLHHPEIQPIHRATLVDWLMEVSQFRHVFCTAVRLLDAFLCFAPNPVPLKTKLQLVGLSALWISVKLHDDNADLKAGKFTSLTDDAFSPAQLMEMESEMLRVLGWRLHPYVESALVETAAGRLKELGRIAQLPCVMRVLDCAVLDEKSFAFTTVEIVSAAVRLVTGEGRGGSQDCYEWIKFALRVLSEPPGSQVLKQAYDGGCMDAYREVLETRKRVKV